jgi:hypothetical protein
MILQTVQGLMIQGMNFIIERSMVDLRRHCLVFWARPTPNVKQLAGMVQKKLKAAFPSKIFSCCFTGHVE